MAIYGYDEMRDKVDVKLKFQLVVSVFNEATTTIDRMIAVLKDAGMSVDPVVNEESKLVQALKELEDEINKH